MIVFPLKKMNGIFCVTLIYDFKMNEFERNNDSICEPKA